MKFIDEAIIQVIAGNGGDGFMHFGCGVTSAARK
jgi:GTPase involved in cell partitioning and DNA repair